LNNLRRTKIRKRVSHVLLSFSGGFLLTGLLYVLYLLALIKTTSNGTHGWIRLNKVMTTLWSPALYCATRLCPTGLQSGMVLIWATVLFNVLIYSLVIYVISSVWLKWVRRPDDAEAVD